MTDAPKRIWADPPETFDGMDVWRSEPGGKGVEYILASEHAALIREAKAGGRIVGLDEAEKIAAGVAGNVRAFNADRRRGAGEVQSAIRAAKGEPT